ncbi:hypothetical protein [Desulfosporosinus sp. BICA1-9]|uniref:hypothetical protein n=1 Tax=Desulfosporosinus sp. BICA1-9 TaxID=1531958 RepID=UPI000AB944D3|nr:hypothetical protein [Desulfosporosinus sp. BICA1-9]
MLEVVSDDVKKIVGAIGSTRGLRLLFGELKQSTTGRVFSALKGLSLFLLK